MTELFKTYWEPTFDAAFKKVGDEEVAQDITQEIFISMWENRAMLQIEDNGTTDLNVPLMRYAEVLLIKAEAAINLSGAGAGDTELNKIRVRAGLAPKTAMTMTDLKRERRNELAGEFADRHRDLVRWGDAQATYAKPLHDYDGAVIWPARAFNPQVHDVWAVPQREIDNSSGLIKQNVGW